MSEYCREAGVNAAAIGAVDHERVLVVEDEPATRDMLEGLLERAGYEVTAVATVAAARRVLLNDPVDLVVLDLNLPDQNGLELDRELAGRRRFGVIIVTARSDVIDTIVGLELGADDYLAKPFNPGELLARVKALLRRLKTSNAPPDRPPARYIFEGWILDLAERSLRDKAGRDVHLTRAEFDLLVALVAQPGRARRRDELLRDVATREKPSAPRAIDALVARLRGKIESDPKVPRLIITVPSYGYRFAEIVD